MAHQTPRSNPLAPARPWRWDDFRFLATLGLPALALWGVSFSPNGAGWRALVILFLLACIEMIWPPRTSAHVSAQQGSRLHHPGLMNLVRLFVPMQFVLLLAGSLAAQQSEHWFTILGLGLATGVISGGQGITYAHELGHRHGRIDRFLAWMLMISVWYPHFMVEHYRGHHVRVATENDPASARKGESLWRFLPRTLRGSFVSAWRLEAARLRQHRRNWLHSPLLWAWLIVLGLASGLAVAGLGKVLAYWCVQAVVAMWLLETINYVEHYGLVRQRLADGRHETFGVGHAWNADHTLTNAILSNLQRHSDHHMNPGKPFTELQALPGPQLPTGYAGCIFLAAFPPLWFAVMDKRLADWQASLVNAGSERV